MPMTIIKNLKQKTDDKFALALLALWMAVWLYSHFA